MAALAGGSEGTAVQAASTPASQDKRNDRLQCVGSKAGAGMRSASPPSDDEDDNESDDEGDSNPPSPTLWGPDFVSQPEKNGEIRSSASDDKDNNPSFRLFNAEEKQ
jgi:hypothetical protein